MKMFTVAGHSVLDGVRKTRFATTMDRVKVLMRNGHTDIELQELPHAMTKDEIRAFFGEEVKADKPKAVKAAAEPAAAAVETAEDAAPDTVKWLEEGQQPAQEPGAVTYATFEEALAAVPKRTEKGTRIKQEVREALARDMVAA
jgi:hypothetical protein